MRRLLKYLAWLLAGSVALFVLAAVALYVFFDPNDFREEISAAVKNRTGRDLAIDGDISLDLFPWLAVEVGKTRLGDAPGFDSKPIAQFDKATFSVRLIPVVLRQQIIVGGATIDGLQLNLKIDAHGASNWADLIPDEVDRDSEAVADAGSELNINRIDIENAAVSYRNSESGEVYTVDGMNLHVGRLRDDGAPVPLDGSLHFDLQPTGLSGDVELKTVLSFDAATGVVEFANVSVEGSIEGVAAIPTAMHFSTDNIELKTSESLVSMQPVDLTMLGLHMTANVVPFSYEERITPQALIAVDEFSPRSMMELFAVEPPATADPVALTVVTIDASAQLTTAAIELSDVSIRMDDTRFSGTLSIPRGATGAYQFDLTGDAIDLNRYMEPADESTGDGSGDDLPIEIPTDLIQPLNARGKLQIATATLADIVFDKLSFGLNASGGRMRLYPVSAQLFGGSYSGDVQIDVTGAVPTLSANEKIDGVNLADLAKAMYDQDNITGTIEGAFVLSGRGDNMAAIQSSLAGTMSFELHDGTFEGTDIWYELRRARARLRGTEPPQPELPAKTSFSTVRASGVVADGILSNDDLYAELPYMQITGAGTVNLTSATVNYGMLARVLERPEFLSDTTPEELDEFTEAIIPLKVTGPLASPSVKPDVEKLLQQRVEEEIKDRLEDKLKDLFN